GNIWVATLNGLDRFRAYAVTPFSVSQGLSSPLVWSVLARSVVSVWLGTIGGLYRWNNGQITISSTGRGKPDGKLNGQNPHSLFQDDRGRNWVSQLGGSGHLENDRFISISGIPGGQVHAIAESPAGEL